MNVSVALSRSRVASIRRYNFLVNNVLTDAVNYFTNALSVIPVTTPLFWCVYRSIMPRGGRVVSCRVVSCRVVSYRVLSCPVESCRHLTPPVVGCAGLAGRTRRALPTASSCGLTCAATTRCPAVPGSLVRLSALCLSSLVNLAPIALLPRAVVAPAGISDADFVLYVTKRPTFGSTIAWALPCFDDTRTRSRFRPVMGHANFSPARISLDPNAYVPRRAVLRCRACYCGSVSAAHFHPHPRCWWRAVAPGMRSSCPLPSTRYLTRWGSRTRR
jgi:hypothetical protein